MAETSKLRRALRWLTSWQPSTPRPGAIAGSYELVARLGAGGMGDVWLAYHRRLQRAAAVKFLRTAAPIGSDRWVSANQRFDREAQIMASIASAHIASIYECGQLSAGQPYYAMELIDGVDLQELVEAHGPQSPRRVAELVARAARAVAATHDSGYVHRDIKPANIMVLRGDSGEELRLIDFGVACSVDDSDDLRREDMVVGTPAYLPPEVVTAPDQIGTAGDIYALGCVAYFLLTGRPPFDGRTPTEVLYRAVHFDTPSLPDTVPYALARVIERCLSKDPAARPGAAELAHTLAALPAGWAEAPVSLAA